MSALYHPPCTPRAPLPEGYMHFMALDFGRKRTGVAVGNRLLRCASACKSIAAQGDARFAAIAALLRQWQPDALVMGIPCHPDGAAHANTRRASAFAQQLVLRFKKPVFGVDERYSTTAALEQGATEVDAQAACIILDQFFSELPP